MSEARSTRMTQLGHRSRGGRTVLGSPNWGVRRGANSHFIQNNSCPPIRLAGHSNGKLTVKWTYSGKGRFNMRRREFITLIGGAAAWPVAAGGQSATPVVAFLAVGSPDALRRRVVAFRKGLSETGWIEHRNVGVEYHWLEGNYVGLPAVLDDVIRRGVAVLAIPGSVPVSVAAKAATATIPIVFGVAEDPVLLGLVKSLAHPGGNATGTNFLAIETDTKRLGLMRELVPKAVRIAVLVNPANVRTPRPLRRHCGTPLILSVWNSLSSMRAPPLRSIPPSRLLFANEQMLFSLEPRP